MITEKRQRKRIPLKQALQGLPNYLGGKRRIAQPIFANIAQAVPAAHWSGLTFADAFLGGGSVSLLAKAQGFGRIICNDWSHRSHIIGQGLIANSQTLLTREDYLRLTAGTDEVSGFIERTYGGSVFSQRHARFLDTVKTNASRFQDPTKRAMCDVLLWHLVVDFVAFGTSVGTSNRPFAEVLDGKRDWWSLNPKRFTDRSFQRLLQPPAALGERKLARINGAVFAAVGTVEVYRKEALDLVTSIEADILYMDPPYCFSTSYEKANQVLDAILLGREPETEVTSSPFTEGTEALSALLRKSTHIPVWALSYGNKAIDRDGLVELVRQADPNRRVEGHAWGYQHLSHVSKNTQNQELFVLAVDEQALAQKVSN